MAEPILTVDHLVKSYDGHTNILENVSFAVKPGEVIVVVGPSGCGKSTLLRCLNGLEPVQSGRVQLGGETVAYGGKNLQALRQRIGIVFQSYELFPHLTVLDNILLAPTKVQKRPKAEVQKEAEALLDRVGLLQKAKSYPRELSGGQKQRISIARAFLKNPPILILDEATSALDNESERIVQASLEKLAKGRTTFTIAHRLTTIKNATKILVLTDKGIEEAGTHQELMKKKGIYFDLYKSYQEMTADTE
jgi:polar amino acid transport system ATP-binding protein